MSPGGMLTAGCIRRTTMINGYSFGKICIHGIWYNHDLKIIGDVVLPDWWRKSGHRCCRQDIEDLLSAEPEVLILGRGKPGMMKADPQLRRFVDKQGIELIELPTAAATVTFNNLYRQKKTAAGFHLTC